MGMGSRKLTKLCGGRRDSGISWLLQSPGLLVVLADVLLRLPQGQLGPGQHCLLNKLHVLIWKWPLWKSQRWEILRTEPRTRRSRKLWFLLFPRITPMGSVYPTQSRGCFCISWTAQLWSWFCILYRQSWAIFSSQEFRRKGPIHLELHCLKEIVAQREAAVGFLKVQNNQAVSCSLHLWSWMISSMGGNHK